MSRVHQGRNVRRTITIRASPSPVFDNAQRRRARQVLDLDPASHASAAVRQIAALRDDAFKAHLAGVREDDRPVTLDVF
jgi:hypothetical protein